MTLDTYVVRPGIRSLASTGYQLSLMPRQAPVLPASLRTDHYRRTLQTVQGHCVVGAQQERALASTMQQLAALQQDWDQHLQHGRELQRRQTQLNTELGLSHISLHTVFDQVSSTFQQ